MLSLVILFAASFVPINEIYAEPVLNLDDLLNALETRQKMDQDLQSYGSSSSDTTDTSGSNDDNDKNGVLQGTQLIHFLQQARDKQNSKKLAENKRLSKLYTHLTSLNDNVRNKYITKNKDLGGDYADLDNNWDNQVNNFVEYLLSQSNKRTYIKDKTAKLKDRNDYLISLNNNKQRKEDKIPKLSDQDDDKNGNLQDYSRIYVILNPEVLKSSQNKKSLSALISRLMSKSSSVKRSRVSPKQLQYKGFPVKGAYAQRRSRRDSMEVGRGSMEDYRPRRPRYNSHYGGGGGAGGRTPIPYIRHRGDIYERDD